MLTKMIGGLIKQQDGWVYEQGTCKGNPHSPTTRKIPSFLCLHLLVKPKSKQNFSSTLLCSCCIQSFKTLIDAFKLRSTAIILRN